MLGRLGYPLGDDACTGSNGGDRVTHARKGRLLNLAEGVEFFRVDDCRLPGQWNGATGVTCAPTPGHNGQAQADAAAHQGGDLVLGVGRQHDKGIFHAPIGRIGHVRDT